MLPKHDMASGSTRFGVPLDGQLSEPASVPNPDPAAPNAAIPAPIESRHDVPVPPTDRPRQAPCERLAPPFASFNLRAAVQELEAEPRPAAHGHRQKVLARHGGATVAIYLFDAGAELKPHAAAGTVTIHCIEGELALTADGAPVPLLPGELLVMAPGIRHGVRAVRRSIMLLTVSLQPAS